MDTLFKILLIIFVAVAITACGTADKIDEFRDNAQDKGILAIEKAIDALDKNRAFLISRLREEYERRVVKLAAQRAKDDLQMKRLKELTEK